MEKLSLRFYVILMWLTNVKNTSIFQKNHACCLGKKHQLFDVPYLMKLLALVWYDMRNDSSLSSKTLLDKTRSYIFIWFLYKPQDFINLAIRKLFVAEKNKNNIYLPKFFYQYTQRLSIFIW